MTILVWSSTHFNVILVILIPMIFSLINPCLYMLISMCMYWIKLRLDFVRSDLVQRRVSMK